MAFLNKVRAFGRFILIIFILASAAFLSAVTAIRFAIEGHQVKMPALVGQKVQDAEKTLVADGLGLRIEDRVYSAYAQDVIVRQSPPEGLRVKVGERAHVVLSLGPQRVLVPDLQNASLRAAHIQLIRDGLQMGESSEISMPDFPADTVVLQDPSPGSLDVTTPRVNLLVSTGTEPGQWVMPDLMGMTQAQAAEKLATAGFKDLKIVTVPDGNPPPPPNTPNAIAPAAPNLTTPPTAEQTPQTPPSALAGAAEAALQASPSGTVIGQTPKPGAMVAEDTAIEVRVAQ